MKHSSSYITQIYHGRKVFSLLEMKVLRVVMGQSGDFSVFLNDTEEKMVLPIAIGPFEAQSIALALQGITPPRPLTHDLITSICHALDVTVEKILITDISEGIFYANIHMMRGDRIFVIDARPSDAIALAVRCNAPIYMAPRLVEFTYRYEDIVFSDQEDSETSY